MLMTSNHLITATEVAKFVTKRNVYVKGKWSFRITISRCNKIFVYCLHFSVLRFFFGHVFRPVSVIGCASGRSAVFPAVGSVPLFPGAEPVRSAVSDFGENRLYRIFGFGRIRTGRILYHDNPFFVLCGKTLFRQDFRCFFLVRCVPPFCAAVSA